MTASSHAGLDDQMVIVVGGDIAAGAVVTHAERHEPMHQQDSGWRINVDAPVGSAGSSGASMSTVGTVRSAEPLFAEILDAPAGAAFTLAEDPQGLRTVHRMDSGQGEGAGDPDSGEPDPEEARGSAETDAGAHEAQGEADLMGETGQPTADPSDPQAPSQSESASSAEGGPSTPIASTDQSPTHKARGRRVATGPASVNPDNAEAEVESSAPWLRGAVQQWLGEASPNAWMGTLSELFGAYVVVPLAPNGELFSFSRDGRVVVPVHSSYQGMFAWQRQLGTPGHISSVVMLGDEALRRAFEGQAAQYVVVDPVEAGVEIAAVDPYLGTYSRYGRLKAAVRSQDQRRILEELTTPGAEAVYMFQPVEGQPAYPQLLTRPSDQASTFALFTSSLEVFRFQSQSSAAEVSMDWVRTNIPADMFLCLDPGAPGAVVEFSPEQLRDADFHTPDSAG